MTNTEIEQYLKRNDVIFVPVGTIEPHAEIPIDALNLEKPVTLAFAYL
jgi:hypothetical protein